MFHIFNLLPASYLLSLQYIFLEVEILNSILWKGNLKTPYSTILKCFVGNLHRERISRTIVIQWSGNIHICTKCMHRTSTQTWRKNSCPYKTFHLVMQSCKMGWGDCIIWVMLVWNSFFLVEESYPLLDKSGFIELEDEISILSCCFT